ncbi:unnamed protein product [Dovyalis caffra]|uniref:Cytochrome P450 n=1 Tax=Dovyalis caffra TaxID=77055 RepID=A0AAV1S895_9ROSI|nr:unnamed protein product [Dovyalis caffra]
MSRTSKKKTAPKAGGAWPFIGHLHLLGGPQPAHIVLGNMADKYGPVFTIKMGVHRALVVSNWEMAKECLTTNDKAFANRPKFLAGQILGYDGAMFGFSPYGPYWRQLRKTVTLELLSSHRLKLLKSVRESEVKVSLKELYKHWDRKKSSSEVLVDMKSWFGDITINVICRIIVGKSMGYATTNGGDEDGTESWKKQLREFFDWTGRFVVSDALPFLRFLDIGGQVRTMKKIAKDLDHFVEGWLEEHRQKKVNGDQVIKGEEDFMDLMLSIFDEADVAQLGRDSRTISKATCLLTMATLLHGFDFATPSDEPIDMIESIGLTNIRATPLDIFYGINVRKRNMLREADKKKAAREAEGAWPVIGHLHLLGGRFVVSDVLPFLRFLDLGGHERAMKKTAKELDLLRASGVVKLGDEDFMDVMLNILDVDAELVQGGDFDTIDEVTCVPASTVKKKKAAPKAGGAWPAIGHLHLLAGPESPHIVLGNMAEKYGPVFTMGPIFTIKMGVRRALETVKECFTTNDKAFADRPKTLAYEILTSDGTMIGFSPYGPYWRQVRKIATVELLSTYRQEKLKDVRKYEIRACLKEMYNLWGENKRSILNNKALVEMKRWFGDLTLNIILRTIVGSC